ncbi:MAG TPA: hypothetical protein PLM53_15955 [Spirochaetota bacterium]|nr:hypothetical protein [Spirochaetota bacterium]HPC40060.1 hypothetical protein [Spirochaetota bacterium]HPL15230.1 hypothetical protein [Spirochaetota bacterium]HQF09940.1 hypothetical protein [Spirochaetota bacterium]HQH98591.1 hypothetical protein [Spirochaetota bacterium]
MTLKPWIAVMGLVICAVPALRPEPALPAKNRTVKQMDFHEFTRQVKGTDPFELTVAGAEHVSFFTGRSYVHYEAVAFCGRDDIRSTYRILFHTADDFTIMYGPYAVDCRYSQVRTCIAPSVERNYRKDELSNPESDRQKSLRSILDDGEGERLLLVEYGLEAGRKYYGRVKTESHHLPPREQGGKPERGEKSVLVISDRPFPNDCELTPLYKGWSY